LADFVSLALALTAYRSYRTWRRLSYKGRSMIPDFPEVIFCAVFLTAPVRGSNPCGPGSSLWKSSLLSGGSLPQRDHAIEQRASS
jgi:hypothetical protein